MSLFQRLIFWCWWTATTGSIASAWVSSPVLSISKQYSDSHSVNKGCVIPTTFALRSSYKENDGRDTQEYRSIAEVVGGLHGGKYQFGGAAMGGIPDTPFSGHGGTECQTEIAELDEELPNWAKKLAPTESQTTSPLVLSVPSNSNPMDGMVYFASISIRNQERTWEKFYAKIMAKRPEGFVEVDCVSSSIGLSVAPRSGSLAPRGGASNACDASKPYSDSATIRITQADTNSGESTGDDLWLVVGTEEEKWAYKLHLVEN
eukprot:CAMPEP_0116088122 /NCGR_PEP_ID=MMETSP0327-20121206/5709_1 /TAXON_ID=44447 /ORGANISM="Pseudo-nitzschia delicatissima, Strain B596" /LENGTH=260 /DNA_ID=CAMNT_0003579197 /DNA_START=93 /DNA_END=875 /DNA_ORIENTATION=+